jgi:hypothetical protein
LITDASQDLCSRLGIVFSLIENSHGQILHHTYTFRCL